MSRQHNKLNMKQVNNLLLVFSASELEIKGGSACLID